MHWRLKEDLSDQTVLLLDQFMPLHLPRNKEQGLPAHSTPASSPWLQLLAPQGLAGHSLRADSVPTQFTSSSQMGPVPLPKWALPWAFRATPQPSSLQITSACLGPQRSSHTVPHCWSWNTSTLPEQRLDPLASLSSEERNKRLRTNLKATQLLERFLHVSLLVAMELDHFHWMSEKGRALEFLDIYSIPSQLFPFLTLFLLSPFQSLYPASVSFFSNSLASLTNLSPHNIFSLDCCKDQHSDPPKAAFLN